MIEGDTKRGFGRLFGRQCYCPSHQSGPHLHMIQEEMCWIDGLYASSGGMAEAEAKGRARMKVLLEMEAKVVMSKPGGGGSKVMEAAAEAAEAGTRKQGINKQEGVEATAEAQGQGGG